MALGLYLRLLLSLFLRSGFDHLCFHSISVAAAAPYSSASAFLSTRNFASALASASASPAIVPVSVSTFASASSSATFFTTLPLPMYLRRPPLLRSLSLSLCSLVLIPLYLDRPPIRFISGSQPMFRPLPPRALLPSPPYVSSYI